MRFDIVLAAMTLMTIARYRMALGQIARVLRPQGRLAIVINHPGFFRPDRDDYFTPVGTSWMFFKGQTAPAPFFHRPLSHYTHALRSNGLLIANILEPKLHRRVASRMKSLKAYASIPFIIVLDCIKCPPA